MSNMHYNLKWLEAINNLQEQFLLEQLPLEQSEAYQPKGPKKIEGELFLVYATLYIKYIEIYKKLENCYDQMVHPQKRQLLREMLDNVMVEMCQSKAKLVRLNNVSDGSLKSDFVNLDELIMDLKLMPDCIEVPIPRFCKESEKQRLDERNQLVDALLVDFWDTNQPEIEMEEEKSSIGDDIAKAIEIINRNERGRQGIEKVYKAKIDKKLSIQKEEKRKRLQDTEDDQGQEEATKVLTKYWKGTIDRMAVQKMREEEMNFLGINLDQNKMNAEDSEDELDFIYKRKQLDVQPKDKKERMEQQRHKMKLMQQKHQEEFEMDLDDLQKLVKDNEGADIKEKMLEERRKWIFSEVEKYEFTELPQKAEDFNNKDNVADEKGQDAIAKKMEEDAKKKGKKDDKKGKKGGKPSDLDEFNADNKPMGASEEVLQLQKLIEQFNTDWAKKDETANFEQKHETQLAMQKVKPTVEGEIQTVVEEMIEIELENIRTAFGIKKKKKAKKSKKKQGIKPSKKKYPGDAFNKGKDPRDILAFLIEKGVVKKFEPALLSDLKGEPDVLGTAQERASEFMSDPSMLQLRQCIAEQIGIPLGSQFARDKLDKNYFNLFYGPQGTGKTLAVRALATECNALLIDISPSNLEGVFTDNKQLQGCLNSAFKVAAAFQPSIIYCQDVEMIFQGKKKKGSNVSTFFQKMKKPLTEFKNKKFCMPEFEKYENDKKVKFTVYERVAFIACSNKPYEGSAKDMKNFFEKKFYFPYPNYATRKLLFSEYVQQKGVQIPENFSLSMIAHITQGFSAGSFKTAIDKVLTQRRLLRIKEEPIKVNEFIGPISNTHATYASELKSFQAFTDDVCGFKERRDRRKNPEDDKDKKGGKKGKK